MLTSLYSLEHMNPERSKTFKFSSSKRAIKKEPLPSEDKDEEIDVDDYGNE